MNGERLVRMYNFLDRELAKQRDRVREHDVDPPERNGEKMVAEQRRKQVREIERERNAHLAGIIALRARDAV